MEKFCISSFNGILFINKKELTTDKYIQKKKRMDLKNMPN